VTYYCIVFVKAHSHPSIGSLDFNSVASDVLEIRGGSQSSELSHVTSTPHGLLLHSFCICMQNLKCLAAVVPEIEGGAKIQTPPSTFYGLTLQSFRYGPNPSIYTQNFKSLASAIQRQEGVPKFKIRPPSPSLWGDQDPQLCLT